MARRRAQRAVSNHGSRFELAAILRDALASLGLLRMRSEWWKDSQPLRGSTRSVEPRRAPAAAAVRASCDARAPQDDGDRSVRVAQHDAFTSQATSPACTN